MIVLFWDIDGTLLTTGKAGVPAWERPCARSTGKDFQLSSIRVPGLTDYQIAVRTFEMLGVPSRRADGSQRMVRRYEELLPAALPLKQGRVLPNVREILEQLRGRPDVRSYLLTGNTRGGARAKLTHYDLCRLLSRRRVRRGHGRSRHDCRRARWSWPARAGPVVRAACSSSATRRTTSSAPTRSACARSRWRPAAIRSRSCRRTSLARVRAAAAARRVPAADRRGRGDAPTARAACDGMRARHSSGNSRRSGGRRGCARRWYHARRDAYPDWSAALAADRDTAGNRLAAPAQGGPRVLMATAIGSYAHAVTLESALAAALTFRGAEVHALLCDGAMTRLRRVRSVALPGPAAVRGARTRRAICAATAAGPPSACTSRSD